jgi:glycosyltransferase involved in cell wall biosynthesis
MKALFVHDHIFLKYDNQFYSKGKLTYKILSYYLKFCNELTVVGRYKDVDFDPGIEFIAEGHNIEVIGLYSPISVKGVLEFKFLKQKIITLIKHSDFIVIRLPSELGLLSNNLSKKLNVPCIVEMVASPFDCLWYRGDFFAKIYAPILHLRTKLSIKKAKYVIYVTSKYLQQQYPTLGINLGVSDARVECLILQQKTLNMKKKFVVGVIANPALKLKGISSLFDAFKMLDSSKFQLDIVGGSLESDLELSIRSHYNINQIGIIADKKDLFTWLEGIDLYVQPSYTEGLPRSIIEAMSLAIPTIGSNVGGIPEVVHNKCLFQPGDVESIFNLINKFSAESTLYADMSKYSILVASRFNDDLDFKKDNFFDDFKRSELIG